MLKRLKKNFSGNAAKPLTAVAAGVLVFVALSLVILSRAAGVFLFTEPEQGTVSGNAQIVSDNTASNGKAVQFTPPVTTPPPPPPLTPPSQCTTGGSYLWANLEACGWPGTGNTGVPAGTTLRNGSSRTITVDNTVIDGENITGNITVNAKNVTIKNSRITYAGNGGGGSGAIKILKNASATITSVEINGQEAVHACVWHEGAAATIQNVNCHHVEDGFFSWAATGVANSGDNYTVTNNYIHDLVGSESNGHWDGFQTLGMTNGLIEHNTFRIRTDGTSAIAIWDDQKNSSNVTVRNNLISGGGFSIYAHDKHPTEANPAGGNSVTNIHFVNNKFSNAYSRCVGGYGVWFYRSSWVYQGGPTGNWGPSGSTRSGNVVLETGFNLDNGNPSGCV